MDKIKTTEHSCVTDTELDKLNWSCDAKDVLLDIKFFMREYYVGFSSKVGESLVVQFINGQKFSIAVTELR